MFKACLILTSRDRTWLLLRIYIRFPQPIKLKTPYLHLSIPFWLIYEVWTHEYSRAQKLICNQQDWLKSLLRYSKHHSRYSQWGWIICYWMCTTANRGVLLLFNNLHIIRSCRQWNLSFGNRCCRLGMNLLSGPVVKGFGLWHFSNQALSAW